MHAKRLRTREPLAAALAILFLPLAVHAAEPVVPGAGSILQQTQPVMPPAPSATGTGLAIEPPGGGTLPPSAPFLIKSIQLSGNTAFDTPTLHALIAEAEGTSLTLPQLGRVAARITDFYHRHGYPLDRAIIPAQTIKDGMVRIVIIEARYGRIALDNRSRVVDSLLQATLAPLQSGQAISAAPLNHALLLLSDVPGVAVVPTLKPGEAVGTSDLQVQTDATPALTGNAALDNDGNRYTGRVRLGGTVSAIDPMQHGDTLSLSGLTSGDMDYGSLSYDSLLNGEGTRLGGAYSALHYILGDTLAPLDGHGSAEVESLWVKQVFVRAPTINLYGQLQYDHKQLDDAISANTQGRFSLWNVNLSRLQHVSASDALFVAISGQWSNANLDPAEKMIAGGAYTVRAYDMGALSADSGILASVEWRHDLGVLWL